MHTYIFTFLKKSKIKMNINKKLKASSSLKISTYSSLFLIWLCLVTKTTSEEDLCTPKIDQRYANDYLTFVIKTSPEHVNVSLILPCNARGRTLVKYTWTKNGKEFIWEAYKDRIVQLEESGSLNITSPQAEDAGLYECTADNGRTKVVTNSVHLRGVEQEYFSETRLATVVTAVEGQPFKLKCNVPTGYINSDVIWIKKDFSKPNQSIQQINSTRKTVDPDGNLWFSSIFGTDASSIANEEYVCVAKARNQSKWHFIDRIFLKVSSADESSHPPTPPTLQYASQRNTAVMQGSNLDLWCVFGGTPTPKISWNKIRSSVIIGTTKTSNNQRTFTFMNVNHLYESGIYICNASNSAGWMSHYFAVNVYAPPFAAHDIAYEDNLLDCHSNGNPSPVYTWFTNGKQMEAESKKKLKINSTTNPETVSYSCNASNIFGFVHKEYSLNSNGTVTKVEITQSDITATIGDTVTLTCSFNFYDDYKSVKWWKDNQMLISEEREHPTRNLRGGKIRLPITNVTFSSAGDYVCQVVTQEGTILRTRSVLVVLGQRECLRIVNKPEDQEAALGQNVTFPCRVVTDKSSHFTVEWLLNGIQLDFYSNSRYIKGSDNSLEVANVSRADSGTYLCVARAGHETVSEFGILKVKDAPTKPVIQSLRCRQQTAIIDVRESTTDFPEVLSYKIEYSTNSSPEIWKATEKHLSRGKFSFEVSMRPWKNYTFRVIAVNKLGQSVPSAPTFLCSTRPSVPDGNPRNVKLKSLSKSSMSVSWNPMSEEEHNAPKFMYVVEWKPENDSANQKWDKKYITDWRANVAILKNLSNSEHYRVRVRAVNEVGESPEKAVELVGYAGHDETTAPPEKGDVAVPLVLTMFTFFIVLLGIGLFFIRRHYRKSVISEAETEMFFDGDESAAKESAYKMPYDKEKFEIDLKSFTLDKEDMLGCGEFGMVCKGKIQTGDDDTCAVAIKTANPNKIHRTIINGLLSEIKVLAHVGKHQNITELIGANTEQLKQGKVYLLLEMCPLGSLEKYLRSMRSVENAENNQLAEGHTYENIIEMNTFSPSTLDPKASQDLIRWSREISDGMAFLALKHVVHADLATRNVLLGCNREAKICDFGLSRRMYNYASYVKAQQEPLPWKWMAPESLRIQEFNEKTDVWAFGVTLWEIYSLGDSPYQGLSWDLNFVQMLQRGFRLGEPEFNERDVYSVIKRCWNFNPDHRPSFVSLVVEFGSLRSNE